MPCALNESNVPILDLTDENRNPSVMARPKVKLTVVYIIREASNF